MALSKETLNNFLPNGFETEDKEGYKTNFSDDKIATGYEKDVADIVSGPNLNNFIDKTGKNFNTLNDYIEYLNNMPINNLPITDSNNKLNYVENNFLNKTQITNCILEAPNGVATYSGNIITVKSGLKVLMPNGRNSDGTLNNIEYTVPRDLTLDTTGLFIVSQYWYIMLENDNTFAPCAYSRFLSGNALPTSVPSDEYYLFYHEKENKFYRTSGSTTPNWTEINKCIIGILYYDKDKGITSLEPYNAINIASRDEIDGKLKIISTDNLIFSSIEVKTYTIDFTDLLPKDGNAYMCYLHYYISRMDTSNVNSFWGICEKITSSVKYWVQDNVQGGTSSTDQVSHGGGFCIPIGANRQMQVEIKGANLYRCELRFNGYRKLSKGVE